MHVLRLRIILRSDDKELLEKRFRILSRIHNIIVKYAIKQLRILRGAENGNRHLILRHVALPFGGSDQEIRISRNFANHPPVQRIVRVLVLDEVDLPENPEERFLELLRFLVRQDQIVRSRCVRADLDLRADGYALVAACRKP